MTYLRICKARNAMYNLPTKIANKANELKDKIVSCDNWFLIMLAVLMCISFVIASALAVWCITYKGSKFTGNWNWKETGVSVMAECE